MNFVGAIAAYLTVNNFGRVSILLNSHWGMAVAHWILAVCIMFEYNFASVLLILVHIFIFQISEGPILWIYSAEVCYDSAFGLVTFGQFLNLFLISVVTEYIIAGLGNDGTFFFFGTMSFIGGIFIKIFVKETRGLNDQQKKQLYKPITSVQTEK